MRSSTELLGEPQGEGPKVEGLKAYSTLVESLGFHLTRPASGTHIWLSYITITVSSSLVVPCGTLKSKEWAWRGTRLRIDYFIPCIVLFQRRPSSRLSLAGHTGLPGSAPWWPQTIYRYHEQALVSMLVAIILFIWTHNTCCNIGLCRYNIL